MLPPEFWTKLKMHIIFTLSLEGGGSCVPSPLVQDTPMFRECDVDMGGSTPLEFNEKSLFQKVLLTRTGVNVCLGKRGR